MFEFDKDYLYHSVDENHRLFDINGKINLENILKDGFILSKRNIFGDECSHINCGFNGYNYISLSKKISSNFLDYLNEINISKLSKITCSNLLTEFNLLLDYTQRESFYRYVPFNITFIFNTHIGEIETQLIPNPYFFQKYTNDGNIRYSDLLGEVQIKDKLELNKAVAIYIPYYINIFYDLLKAKIHNKNSIDIESINQKTLNYLLLIERYYPNIPTVDLFGKKVLTKNIF